MKPARKAQTPDQRLEAASAWWSTAIVDIQPGQIAMRGYPIEELIGRVSFPRMVWLQLVREAEARGEIGGRYGRIAESVERVLQGRKGSPIPMNIDGVTAVIYSELGFAPPLGRGLFILSRSVGILARAWEQTQQGGRIKGPMSPDIPYRYTGIARRSLASGDETDSAAAG